MDIDAGRLDLARELVQKMIDGAGSGQSRGHARPPRGHHGAGLRHHHHPAGRAGRLRPRHRDPAQVRRGPVRGRHAGPRRRLPRPAHHPGAARHLPRHGRAGARRAADQLCQPHGDQLLGRRRRQRASACRPLPQRAGHQRDAGALDRRALRRGHLPLRRASTTRPGSSSSATGTEDPYPRAAQAIARPEIEEQEPVRIDLLKQFGYFVTESSGHACEYVPYFRKSAAMIEEELVPRFGQPQRRLVRLRPHRRLPAPLPAAAPPTWPEEYDEQMRRRANPRPARTHEYGSYIIEAMETNAARPDQRQRPQPRAHHQPAGTAAASRCPAWSIATASSPPSSAPAAAAGRAQPRLINVQELTVEAALDGDRERSITPSLIDPLTAAACTLPQVHAMVNEMLARRHSGCRSSAGRREEPSHHRSRPPKERARDHRAAPGRFVREGHPARRQPRTAGTSSTRMGSRSSTWQIQPGPCSSA